MYDILAHVSTGDIATAALQNTLIDDMAVLKTSIDDNGHLYDPVMVSVSANYSITAIDDVVLCNGTFNVTLLTAVGRAGRTVKVKQVGTGTVTMASTSSQTIDGATATAVQIFPGDALTFESDGANWVIV